jgi:hypothetical protein
MPWRRNRRRAAAFVAFGMRTFVRMSLAIGFCIDAGVAVVALFFQSLLGPLFDLPLKDPALTTIAGGEYIVVAFVYALVFREPERYRALLWVCALDQLLAALLPGIEIARGNVAATYKTIGPIPLSALLAAAYVWSALRFARDPRRSASHPNARNP